MQGNQEDAYRERIVRYVYAENVCVAWLDVLGFKSAMNHARVGNRPSGQLIFDLWRNAFLPLRTRLTIPADGSPDGGSRSNFVQLSDSLVVYAQDPDTVLDLVCDLYGSALVWGVPIRGGVAYGELFHLEDPNRPGTAITLYGDGQIEAYETEQAAQGRGMRLFLAPSFLTQLGQSPLVRRHCCGNPEYAWWLRCGVPRDQFRERVEAWWTTKNVGQWFTGKHRTDTERVFSVALEELGKAGVAR